jgi:hypothetical protein
VAPLRFQPEAILEVLIQHDVRFVVIGGLAALAHGSPIPTSDVDITPDPDQENLSRLSAALRDLDARIWAGDATEPLPCNHDAASLASAPVWNLATRFGRFDISMRPNGTDGYRDLARDATREDVLGVVVPVASLADVIRSKQAANRPKDQRVLPVLREILASRFEQR